MSTARGHDTMRHTCTCCGRMLGKLVLSSCVTNSCTNAALLGYAVGPLTATSHRGLRMASEPATLNRWCRIRACILNPGLWKVSARK